MTEVNAFNKISNLTLSQPSSVTTSATSEGRSFADVLKNSIDEGNKLQKESDRALADVASGQIKDLHQAAIAIGKAENSMKLMLEVRNKAISAYKEILRTQI
ncbi:MAG: flagellar hook-basal body complex protein FliE [Wolinella sp.]